MKKLFTYMASVLGGMFYAMVSVLASTQSDQALQDAPGVNLTIQSLFGVIAGLACWSTRFVTIIMVVMIVWYGFQMMLAQSNTTKFANARKSLGYAVIGMIVILGAYTIIATVGNTIQGIGNQDLSSRSKNFINYTPLGSCSYNP
jgi:hypothetical protein